MSERRIKGSFTALFVSRQGESGQGDRQPQRSGSGTGTNGMPTSPSIVQPFDYFGKEFVHSQHLAAKAAEESGLFSVPETGHVARKGRYASLAMSALEAPEEPMEELGIERSVVEQPAEPGVEERPRYLRSDEVKKPPQLALRVKTKSGEVVILRDMAPVYQSLLRREMGRSDLPLMWGENGVLTLKNGEPIPYDEFKRIIDSAFRKL